MAGLGGELWEFARGDLAASAFERWLYPRFELEPLLGHALYMALVSADYRDRDAVWAVRKVLREALGPLSACECLLLPSLAVVPMGPDHSEKILAPLDRICSHGGKLWWLYLSRCRICSQHWLVAQDTRIYDNLYLKRLSETTAEAAGTGRWPEDFITYERVLELGATLSAPCIFLDPYSHGLQFTIEDLRSERPGISPGEIARLLGITLPHARRLYWKVRLFGTRKLPA